MPNETGCPVGIHVLEVILKRKARERVTQISAEWERVGAGPGSLTQGGDIQGSVVTSHTHFIHSLVSLFYRRKKKKKQSVESV